MRQRGGALKLWLCLGEAAHLEQKVPTHARQEVVGLERRLRHELVDQLQTRRRTERHRDRDCAIQLDDRRRRKPGKSIVERGNLLPIRFGSGTRPGMTRRDGGLQRVRTKNASKFFGTLKSRETATD